MIAKLQRVLMFTVLLLAAAFAFVFWRQGHPGWALVACLMVTFGHMFVLAAELLVMRRVHGSDPTPRATAVDLLLAWWAEARAAPVVFCWRQPFRSTAVADWLGPMKATGAISPGTAPLRGVVMIHGLVCNRGFWNPWMRALRRRQVPYSAVTLEPAFGSIDEYVPIVEAAVRRIEAATGRAPVMVGHSMGGLAVRAWLDRHAADDRAHRVITIGTPHYGTWLARFAISENARQMRIGSAWLQALSAREPPTRAARFSCFYSDCDNVVFPASTACLPGALNIHRSGFAHVHLASDPAVFDEVMRWVGADTASAAVAAASSGGEAGVAR